ncbi:universal stress protein [Umezawaea beigongshangensis]|uniref:universal stress protein n=1 Tax=Umezawaea beigongshangensis TaxID=2780383 RepID=UPI0018F1D35E|nr:universal stress protein [Umezawaea beigongshangensis]
MVDDESVPPVVVGVDGSASALRAAEWGAGACARHDVPLRLVHGCFVPVRGYPAIIAGGQQLRRAMDEQARQWLCEAESVARAVHPGVVVRHVVRMEAGGPALVAESVGARLVVLGSRGLDGFAGLLAGSTATALSAHGRCPVVVVRDGERRTGGPVVVGVDGSPPSDAAVGFAFDEAAARGVPLVAVSAWSDVFVEASYGIAWTAPDLDGIEVDQWRLLAERLSRWRERHSGVPVQQVVVRDRPAVALLGLAAVAQLVVVGDRGRGGFAGMVLGSTGQAVVQHAPCAVAVVRAG